MKTATLLSILLLASLPGGDREKGLQLYREGKFREAAAAFEAAIRSEGDSAELQFNLALARWRAGDLPDAETAVEKYVAMAGDARTDLHAGVLGAVRFDEAKALEAKADALAGGGAPPAQLAPRQPAAPAQPEDPLPLLEQAVQKATQAKDHFVRGAVAGNSPELQRNTERTLRLLAELQKKIDELKKQREEQKKDDQQKSDDKKDEKKDDEKQEEEKKDEQKKDEQQKGDEKQEQKPDEQKQDDKQQGKPDEKPKEGEGKEKPEPKPGEQEPKPEQQQGQPQEGKGDEPKQPEPKPGEQQKPDKPEAAQPRHDAPGEMQQGKELSPEQAQRLMDELQKLDEQLKAFRARAKSGRRPVERDW